MGSTHCQAYALICSNPQSIRPQSSRCARICTHMGCLNCVQRSLQHQGAKSTATMCAAHLQALRTSRLKLLVRGRRGRVSCHLGFPLLLGLLHARIREEAEVLLPRGPADSKQYDMRGLLLDNLWVSPSTSIRSEASSGQLRSRGGCMHAEVCDLQHSNTSPTNMKGRLVAS